MGRKLSLLESLKLKKGDTFEFGVWEGRPIEWLVLATRGGIFCFSKYCLDNRRFDEESDVWKDSELRQWLNSDFYNKAFDSEEKSFILSYEGDKVTLLSIEEVERYLPSKSKRKATNRDGKVSNRDGSMVWWWLRSPGRHYRCAMTVSGRDGSVYHFGEDVYNYAASVRPVILLRKDVENYLELED